MPLHVIHSGNAHLHQNYMGPDGKVRAKGLIPRDFSKYPQGYLGKLARPFDLPLIPETEWQGRLDAQKAAHAQLSDIRNVSGPNGSPIPSRDQDGVGYCWCHSGTSAHLLVRAVMGEPYIDLSAFSVGCMIKNFQDEGGFGAEGVEFQGNKGIATSKFWPQQSMDRANDNPATWADAAKHKYIEWMDGADSGDLVKQQLVTALLLNLPCIVDYDWWSHSVCGMNLESLNPFQIRIWNSWGDSWSENGTGILEGDKALPNGFLADREKTVSCTCYFCALSC